MSKESNMYVDFPQITMVQIQTSNGGGGNEINAKMVVV